jgi:hypothetical protein
MVSVRSQSFPTKPRTLRLGLLIGVRELAAGTTRQIFLAPLFLSSRWQVYCGICGETILNTARNP